MTQRLKRIAALLFTLMICLCLPVRLLQAEGANKTSNRFNVVFVLDSSGSMKDTDPEDLRFAAVSLFLGLLAEKGNYLGGVVFSDDVNLDRPLTEITSIHDKKQALADFQSIAPGGWTNTGAALLKAEEILEQKGGEGLPDIILYLTDGNTDMPTDEKKQLSLDQKAEAIQNARENGTKIYSVCLNANSVNSGTTNPQEMEQIAIATGGGFEEVHNSDDLAAVFKRFYELIYSTVSSDIGGGTFDQNGSFLCDFRVPAAGVEEVNIISAAGSDLTGLELTQPSGITLSAADTEQLTMHAGKYSITKLTGPEGGAWTLHATGSPGAKIDISMIFNTSLSVASEVLQQKETYQIGDVAQLKTTIMTDGEETADPRVLEDYQVSVTVTNEKGTVTPLDVRAENGQFLSDFTASDYGTYTFRVSAEGSGIWAGAEPITIYVGNTPPVYNGVKLEQTGYIWPLFDLDCAIDLAGAATDQEDDTLTYSVVSSSFLDDSYTLDGTVLKMLDFDISMGSFTIRATDSMGAYCDFEVYMKSHNMGFWFALITGIGIALFLIITAIRFYQIKLRYFHGKFYVTAFTDEKGDVENTAQKPIRGRYRLSAFGLNTNVGLPYPKIFFQASGKSTHCMLFSRQKIYVMGSNVPSNIPAKKFRVNSNAEITLSADASFSKGLRITFEPEE